MSKWDINLVWYLNGYSTYLFSDFYMKRVSWMTKMILKKFQNTIYFKSFYLKSQLQLNRNGYRGDNCPKRVFSLLKHASILQGNTLPKSRGLYRRDLECENTIKKFRKLSPM